MTLKADVRAFYEHETNSVQYVASDPTTGKCAIIDPVLNFSVHKNARLSTESADEILAFVLDRGFEVQWILDTHLHADHFSASYYIKQVTGAVIAASTQVVEAQKIWKEIYNLHDLAADGSQWDHLFADGETFHVGNIPSSVLNTPGHTPASITYLIGDAAFINDSLFMPDSGTARADFPGGSAAQLWMSIQKIIALPETTRLFTGHDYQPNARDPRWESTIADQKTANLHLLSATTAEQFVKFRNNRDRDLPIPKLMLQALQVNIRGGMLPNRESNNQRYLKIPLSTAIKLL